MLRVFRGDDVPHQPVKWLEWTLDIPAPGVYHCRAVRLADWEHVPPADRSPHLQRVGDFMVEWVHASELSPVSGSGAAGGTAAG
jgi:hypothetical protein